MNEESFNDYNLIDRALLDLQNLETSIGFEDVAIKQNKNICKSRLDANIESEVVRDIKIDVPLIAANMSSVVNADFCIQLRKLGALGILHRADTEENIVESVKKVAKECDITAASVGVGESQLELAKKIIQAGGNIICIDIAHGYSDTVIQLAKDIKKYSKGTKVIVGNTTNPGLLIECIYAGCADAIKIGLASGYSCSTKNTAGCFEKQFSAVYKFKYLAKHYGMPIISDGGIREPADFVKAIGAGANAVMAGSIFARCPESAAQVVRVNDKLKKEYFGMASALAQEKWKGGLKSGTCAEGVVKYLDMGESVESLLERYAGALRSGITYAGGNDICSFHKKAKFIKIT